MKNNKGIAPLIVVLIVAGILVLGGAGYVYLQKIGPFRQVLRTLTISTSTPKITPEEAGPNFDAGYIDPNAFVVTIGNSTTTTTSVVNWKTYSFPTRPYQISYPADLQITENSGGFLNGAPFFTFPSAYLVPTLTKANIGIASVVNKGGADTGNENTTVRGQLAQPFTINGVGWFKTDQTQDLTRTVTISDGTDASAGMTLFNLSMTASIQSGLNGAEAQNIISIFEKMIASFKSTK